MSELPSSQPAIIESDDGTLGLRNDVQMPSLEDDMILVRNAFVALNPIDTKMVGKLASPGAIAGKDFAGEVVSIGPKVQTAAPIKPGDRICGAVPWMHSLTPAVGAFAQYVGATDLTAIKIPEYMSLEEAVTLGSGIGTIGLALFKSLDVPGSPWLPADKPVDVLVYGGSTATGTLAIQLLKLSGLNPITTCSPTKFDLVKSYGATAAFDYPSGGIFHQALAGGEHTALHFQVLGAHVVAFVAFAVYWMILYPRYFTPFGNIPTPSRRRILTGNYPVLFPDNAWVPLRELAETTPNDGLLRIYSALSGEALLVTSPPAIRDMLTVNAFDFTHQDLVKIAIRRFTGSNLGFLSNDEFKASFTVPHVRKLTSIFWAKAQEMVRCMSNELRADSFARIDFREYMSRATLNNIGLAGMGHDFQTLKQPDTDLRSHHRKLILDPTRVFSWVGLLSRYFDMRLLMRVPLKKLIEISQSAKYLRELTTAVIQGRREQLVVAENNRGKDIITVALAGGVFDEHHLVDHVMTFLTAGHESTATAFEWTMYELGRRPEMQSRLRDELRATIGTDLAAVNFGLRVQNLPYLNAFCSEVLRCYPFSPIIVKVAQKETMLIGQRIPKGTVVLYSAEVSNHDKTLWGPDADKFDPERWMGAKKAKSGGASSNYAMLTFGAGPRNCIGANFARATLECLVAAVLSTFEIELANPDTAGRLKFGQTKKSAEGIYGRLKFVQPVEV
ncbi:hypothetical protein KXV77_002975 [Aspergillus fumigatus]|nr:hypothetical protein KXV77_002975 [Aspergillus fumigatus]